MRRVPEMEAPAPGPKTIPSRWYYDFDRASDTETLSHMISYINRHGYVLVSVTQDKKGTYTVFFRRPVP